MTLSTLLPRRDFCTTAAAQAMSFSIAGALLQSRAMAQSQTERAPLNHFPRMMQEWVVDRVRESQARRLKIFNQLKTREDAEKYVASVQEKIRQCFGPFPEKTPLNPQVTRVLQRDGYRIENVVFESRPKFYVTANLYVPEGREGKLPGVVGTCGHSTNGKAEEAYQSFAQGLARQGYVTLIYDPIGQGERLQYPTEELRSQVGPGVREHLLAGNQQFLVGEFFGSWRAWDGIRALDYLLERPEVDPQQVGVTGNSGGGTMTTWLCGVEQRWAMAAPSCFVTTFRRDIENELPQDTEQCPPRVLAMGLDHEDFLAALAPKPVIILAKEKDYFDARGAEEAHGRLRKLYKLLGAEENVGLFIGPTYHGYTQENREAMYRWFNGATKVSDAKEEPALTIEKDEDLYAAPDGQVVRLGSRTVMSFTAEESKRLAEARSKLAKEKLQQRMQSVLKLPAAKGAPDYRILRPLRSRGFPRPYAVPYAVETEPGVHAVVYGLYSEQHYSRPPQGQKRAILYVSHHSADDELRTDDWLKGIIDAELEAAVYACDVRGIGESRPDTCGEGSFLSAYGSDYFYAACSIMLDRPYPGQRTFDLLRTLEWMQANGHEEIHLIARGWGAVPATFAATLSNAATKVTLKHALTSFADVAQSEEYDWPLSSFVPGVLKEFDLPDCYAALGDTLDQVEPRGAKYL